MCECTAPVAVDEVGQIKVQFPDGDVNVVRVDAKARMEAVGRFL